MLQGERCTGIGTRIRRRLFAAVAVVLASVAIPAAAQKKAPAAPVAPATPPAAPAPASTAAVQGSVVSYEEMKQTAIVYKEESGGMTVGESTRVATEPEETSKTARIETKSPENRTTSTGTSTGTNLRRSPPRRDAAVPR